MGEAALIIGLSILRIDPDQKVVVQNRALEIASGTIGLGPIQNRADMARGKTDGLAEIADGAIGIPVLEIDQSAAKEIVDFFRIDFDRAIEVRDGGVDVTLCAMRFGTKTESGGQPVQPTPGGLDVSVAGGDRCCRRRRCGETDAPEIVLEIVLEIVPEIVPEIGLGIGLGLSCAWAALCSLGCSAVSSWKLRSDVRTLCGCRVLRTTVFCFVACENADVVKASRSAAAIVV